MLVILLSWMCIGASAFLWGIPVLELLDRIKVNNRKHLTAYIVSGLCALTVYAQCFSMLYKVGRSALIPVILTDAAVAVFRKKRICAIIRALKPGLVPRLITVVLSCFVISAISSGYIYNSDTYLYHAQAIRWIEEYGIVKGLGNIHSRFAFNSSFLCLQALFSFKGFTSHSLHSVNGFAAWMFFSYSLCTMKSVKGRKVYPSDFMRICMLVLLSHNTYEFSSPGTDFFAHTLSVYIVCEWLSLIEEKESSAAPYALLSILCVYAFTLKLSAALIMLLAIRPACMLAGEKRVREIVLYLFAGFLVAAPYLVRNVIISGYLIYPFEKIDLFSVDWKMPAEVVEYERLRTASWAREIFGVLRLDSPISEWFPYWLEKQDGVFLTWLVLDIASCVFLLTDGLKTAVRNKRSNYLFISAILMICLLYWFVSAPHIRFGRPYVLMPIFLAAGMLAGRISIGRAWIIPAAAAVLIARPLAGIVSVAADPGIAPVYCADYGTGDADEIMLDDTAFYVPEDGMAGYYTFPAVLYADSLDNVEMRGDNISDGFRYVEK